MASVNKVILIGNLGKDPESRAAGGSQVCKFPIATSESWFDKESGAKQERTEWHNIVAWGKQAEICAKYLAKGSQVFVEGSIQTESWEAENGEKKYRTTIKAQHVTFLSPPKGLPADVDVGESLAETAAASKVAAAAGFKTAAKPSAPKLRNHAPGADNSGLSIEDEMGF